MPTAKLPLSEVLGTVAEELLKAQKAAVARGFAAMQFAECEMEFAIEAEREGETGVHIWFVDLGGSLKRTETNTIRIKFTANPDQAVVAPGRKAGPAPKPARQSRKKE